MNESVNFMCWHISHGTQVSTEWFEKNKYTLRKKYKCAHIHEDIYTNAHTNIYSHIHTHTHASTLTHRHMNPLILIDT